MPKGIDAGRFVAQACEGEIDVLSFDVVGEGKFESALNERVTFASGEASQCGVFLVGVFGRLVLVEQDVVFFFAAVAECNGVDAATDVRVNGRAIAGDEVGEHGLRGGDDSFVAGKTGAAEEESFELRGYVVLVG